MSLTAIAFAKFVAVVVEAHSAATLLPEMENWAVNGKRRTFMFFLNSGDSCWLQNLLSLPLI